MHEAQTPLFRFPEDSPYKNIFIKREDLSETGSHKFRYLKSQMKRLKEQGVERVVLSTTGNVGITASVYGKQLGIEVFCLMSDRGDMDKAAQIEQRGGFLILSSRPVRFAKYLSKKYHVPLLRGSQDDFVVEHYRSLGEEIQQQVPGVAAVVNFGTSGTSTVGLMSAWKESLPALHLVQSGRSNSIVKALHPEQVPATTHEEPGLEDTPRREELLEYIRKSKGDAWYVQNYEIAQARVILHQYGLETSWEGECVFAVAQKIKDQYESVLVIFSGKRWPKAHLTTPHRADTFEEIDQLWSESSSRSSNSSSAKI